MPVEIARYWKRPGPRVWMTRFSNFEIISQRNAAIVSGIETVLQFGATQSPAQPGMPVLERIKLGRDWKAVSGT